MSLPFIDENYRTCPTLSMAYWGLSRGAAGLSTWGLRWELFGAIGAQPAGLLGRYAHVRQWLKDILSDALPRIYLDIGK
jgi:hypothetical protein